MPVFDVIPASLGRAHIKYSLPPQEITSKPHYRKTRSKSRNINIYKL